MKLQKVPRGLLELLRLRTDGVNPTEFSAETRTNVDSTDMYAVDLLFTEQLGGAAGGVDTTINVIFSVPVRLRAVSATMTIGANAGTVLDMAILVATSGASPFVTLFHEHLDGPGPNLPQHVGGYLSRPLILLPGMRLRTVIAGDQIGADHVGTIEWLAENLSPRQDL